MNKYLWTVQPVQSGDVEEFAASLEQTLNTIELNGFEVDDIMDAPGGRSRGVIVIGKKARPLA